MDEQRKVGLQAQDALKRLEAANEEKLEMRGKVELLLSKLTNLERENTKLYQQINYNVTVAQTQKPVQQ